MDNPNVLVEGAHRLDKIAALGISVNCEETKKNDENKDAGIIEPYCST